MGTPFEVFVVAGQAVASIATAPTGPPATTPIPADLPPTAVRPSPPPTLFGLILVGATVVTGTAYVAHEYIIADLTDEQQVGAAALLAALLSELNPTTQVGIDGISAQVQRACTATNAVDCLDVAVYVPSSTTPWSPAPMPETAIHIHDALTPTVANPTSSNWWLQNYSPGGAAALQAGFPRGWHSTGAFAINDCTGRDTTIWACDEFPFWATEKAVTLSGVRASLRRVPGDEASPQGFDTGAFYRRCLNFVPSAPFVVITPPVQYINLGLPSLGLRIGGQGLVTDCLSRQGPADPDGPTATEAQANE